MRKINKIIMAGAGRMGYLIAEIAAKKGFEVILYNRGEETLNKAKKLIELDIEQSIIKEEISREEGNDTLSKIQYTCDKMCFKTAKFVLESIVENMDAKHTFFEEICSLVPDDAILATNTSGFSITEIAKAVKKPERFCGMHWWNPPHIVPLIEVIKGDSTNDETAQIIENLCLELGKEPVVVKKDIKGFIGNRIQQAVLRESLHIVASGAATYEDVDRAIKYGVGMRYAYIGPFETVDFNGVDIFNNVCKYMFAELDNTNTSPKLLEDMINENKLGIKTCEGFYKYTEDEAKKAVEKRDEAFKRVIDCLKDMR